MICGTICLILFLNLSNSVHAGNGSSQTVGVLNVGPAQITTRIVPQDDMMRVYLTTLDYNSWEDIFKIDIILEYHGTQVARLTFNQYDNRETFVKSNTFSESSLEGNLLSLEKSYFRHSEKKETVDDRCNLELLFVFRITWFTHIRVTAEDREGLTSSTIVEYSTEDLMRSSNMIMIPWLDGPILVGISSFVINIIAILGGVIGAFYLTKKLDLLGIINYGKT